MPILIEFVMNYQSYVYPKLEYDKPIDETDPPLTDDEKNFIRDLNLEDSQDNRLLIQQNPKFIR